MPGLGKAIKDDYLESLDGFARLYSNIWPEVPVNECGFSGPQTWAADGHAVSSELRAVLRAVEDHFHSYTSNLQETLANMELNKLYNSMDDTISSAALGSNRSDETTESLGSTSRFVSTINEILHTDRDTAMHYTKNQYKKDAACIFEVAKRLNEFPAASRIIMPRDVSAAKSILNCMDRKKAQEMKDKATKFLAQTYHFATDEDSFRKFLRRFRNGPSERDDDDLENNYYTKDDLTTSESKDNVPNPIIPEPRQTPLPSRTSKGDRNRKSGGDGQRRRHGRWDSSDSEDGNRHRPRRNEGTRARHFDGGPPSSDSSDSSDSPDSDSDGYRRRRHRHYSRRHRRNNRKRSSSRSPSHGRDRKLRPEDVMLYDPKTISVVAFTKRIKQIRNLCGKQAVLKVLPLCLRGKALDWYTHLSEDITEDMQYSLGTWIKHLERRFKRNPLDARREADRLKFRYSKETDLPLRDFIEKKVMLLQESGTFDEDQIVSRVWESLDPILMAIIRPEGQSLDRFTNKLYRHEVPGRLLWLQGQSKGTYSKEPKFKAGIDNKEARVKGNTQDEKPGKQPMSSRSRQPFVRERNCRHCGGEHWDFDCPTRKKPARVFVIEEASTSSDDGDRVQLESTEQDSVPSSDSSSKN